MLRKVKSNKLNATRELRKVRKVLTFDHVLENVCLPKTVFSNLFKEMSFQCFVPKSHSLSTTISQGGLNIEVDFSLHCSL